MQVSYLKEKNKQEEIKLYHIEAEYRQLKIGSYEKRNLAAVTKKLRSLKREYERLIHHHQKQAKRRSYEQVYGIPYYMHQPPHCYQRCQCPHCDPRPHHNEQPHPLPHPQPASGNGMRTDRTESRPQGPGKRNEIVNSEIKVRLSTSQDKKNTIESKS